MDTNDLSAFTNRSVSPDDYSTVCRFTEEVVDLRGRHSTVVETMAEVLAMAADEEDCSRQDWRRIQSFLDMFHLYKIGIQLLLNQHTLLFGDEAPLGNEHRMVGLFDERCEVAEVAKRAYADARLEVK